MALKDSTCKYLPTISVFYDYPSVRASAEVDQYIFQRGFLLYVCCMLLLWQSNFMFVFLIFTAFLGQFDAFFFWSPDDGPEIIYRS